MTPADAPDGPALQVRWLGHVDYDTAHALQLAALTEVMAGRSVPQLLLLEHQPVVTLGRRVASDDLRVSRDELGRCGIALRHVERGGRATYHGPGQLVGYVIAPVRAVGPTVPGFVWRIEEALLGVAIALGVAAQRDPRNHGLWVGDAKLAFIGLAVRRGISWHGFALNIDPDLSAFDLIRPCGMEISATSIRACNGAVPPLDDVAGLTATWFQKTMFAPLAHSCISASESDL